MFCLDKRETISTHENVLSSWEQSVTNHVNSRDALINKSLRKSENSTFMFWSTWRSRRNKYNVYAVEELTVEVKHVENSNFKSIYQVKHVKKRRKIARVKCLSCKR